MIVDNQWKWFYEECWFPFSDAKQRCQIPEFSGAPVYKLPAIYKGVISRVCESTEVREQAKFTPEGHVHGPSSLRRRKKSVLVSVPHKFWLMLSMCSLWIRKINQRNHLWWGSFEVPSHLSNRRQVNLRGRGRAHVHHEIPNVVLWRCFYESFMSGENVKADVTQM